MANISVVGRIASDDIELKVSANNRPYLRFDLAERTGKGAYARTQYYQVVAFGAIASQFAKRELHRGALINVEGVLELEDYPAATPSITMIRTARRHERLTRGTVNRSRPIVVGTRCLPIHICRRKSPYLVSGSAHRTSTMQIFCVISSPRQ